MADDTDKFMKDLGYPGGGKRSASAGPDTAQASEGVTMPDRLRPKTYDEMDWQQKMGQGVAKNLAGVATGVPRLINKGISLVSPGLSETLGDYAERIPGVKRMEDFAQSESEGPLESIGSGLTTAATLVMGPGEWGLGNKAAEMITRGGREVALPGTFRAGAEGGQFSLGWPGAVTGLPTRGERIARGVGNVAEAAGRGAVSGAVAAPDDPLMGGAIGGVTGGLARPLGGLLKSEIGQMAGGHAARGTAWAAVQGLGHAIGVPAHVLWAAGVPEAILFWHSPLGKILHGGGRRAAELVGRALVKADPRIPAGATSKIADWLLNSQPGQNFTQGAGQEIGNYVMGQPAGTTPAEPADVEPEGS